MKILFLLLSCICLCNVGVLSIFHKTITIPKLIISSNSRDTDICKEKSCEIVAVSSTVGIKDQLSLTYFQSMAAGAISRTMAQVLMHPANTYKTVLQLRRTHTGSLPKLSLNRLFQGADAQFLFSLPHGAFYFAVIEQVKIKLLKYCTLKPFIVDFVASSVSTIVCSIVSTPQMVLTDRLMADMYPSFPEAVRSIMSTEGVRGFYTGWWPALVQKLPSYGLTWMFFQQFIRLHEQYRQKKPNSQENFVLGAVAAAASVCVMNPIDTVKTRLVTQTATCVRPYKGVMNCLLRIMKEEGPVSLYRSLPPRLLSVVPMIAIQFGVYEFMKGKIIQRRRGQFVRRARSSAAVAAPVPVPAATLRL